MSEKLFPFSKTLKTPKQVPSHSALFLKLKVASTKYRSGYVPNPIIKTHVNAKAVMSIEECVNHLQIQVLRNDQPSFDFVSICRLEDKDQTG